MREDPLGRRYTFKLGSSVASLGANIIIQAVVARGLGPRSFGDFSFLTSFFQQVVGFFDLWTTPAFFVKLSQRPRDFGLVAFTFAVVGAGALLLVGGVLAIPPGSALHVQLWPGQAFGYLVLASVWAVLMWLVQLLGNVSDAYGTTVKAETGRVVQKLLGLVIIVGLYALDRLHLTSYFAAHYAMLAFLIVYFLWLMRRTEYARGESWRLPLVRVRGYAREFVHFSHPLFLTGVVALVAILADRWLLQVYAGSVEQGFYGLSYQIGMVCFVFSGAMTPLIIREFSIAHGNRDTARMAQLFRDYIPPLYSMAAFIGCFLGIQAGKVVLLMGGSGYGGAAGAVAVMSFYPVHQTYGQLSGSVFMATGQTRLYGRISIVFLLLGLPLTYLLVASAPGAGLHAGATGLAVKMVAIQLIAVNVQLYFNAKYLSLRYHRYLGHQFASVAFLVTVALLSMVLVDRWLNPGGRTAVNFVLGGLIYTTTVAATVAVQPLVMGLRREQLSKLAALFARRRDTPDGPTP